MRQALAFVAISLCAACKPPAPPPAPSLYDLTVERQITRSQQMQGAVAFIGDSITAGLATSQVIDKSENFGINSDTVAGALGRVRRMDLRGARAVVLAVGVNSLGSPTFQGDFKALLAAIPRPTVAVGVFPVRPPEAATVAQIAHANWIVRDACAAWPRCHFLDLTDQLSDAGVLKPPYSQPDGIHLTVEGYRVYATELRKALAKTTR